MKIITKNGRKRINWFRRHWIISILLGVFILMGVLLIIEVSDHEPPLDDLDKMFVYEKLNECRKDCVGEKPEKATLTDIQILFECDKFCKDFYDTFGEEELNKYLEEIRK